MADMLTAIDRALLRMGWEMRATSRFHARESVCPPRSHTGLEIERDALAARHIAAEQRLARLGLTLEQAQRKPRKIYPPQRD